MTDLTLEELAELLEKRRVAQDALSVPGPLTQRGYEARRDFSDIMYKHEAALLAMARELVRIRSAAEFLQVSDRRVCLVVDYRAPGEATYQIRAWAIPQVAAMLGWSDPLPPSERKGDG